MSGTINGRPCSVTATTQPGNKATSQKCTPAGPAKVWKIGTAMPVEVGAKATWRRAQRQEKAVLRPISNSQPGLQPGDAAQQSHARMTYPAQMYNINVHCSVAVGLVCVPYGCCVAPRGAPTLNGRHPEGRK
jgi:Na+-translocating ferredoxin:NAD+ oxidoreductase RNF subunit RnfB